jgi:hypothetical protein
MLKSLILILGISVLLVQCNHVKTESTGNAMEANSSCNQIDTCTESSETTQITCPLCNYIKTEILPTDVCVIAYTCDSCHTELFPEEGDCCVYCTYGTHKCPSKQE